MSEQEKKFETKLTRDEIGVEIQKVGDFFKQIPAELKAEATQYFIQEIITWGSYNFYEALGILEEAKSDYRISWRQATDDTNEKERVAAAYEKAVPYQCMAEFENIDDFKIGDIVKAVCAGEDENYSGGSKYDVFTDNTDGEGVHHVLCKTSFELVGG